MMPTYGRRNIYSVKP